MQRVEEIDTGKFISSRISKADSLLETINNSHETIELKAKAFEELVDEWNDGFPGYRHPLLEEILEVIGDACNSSILYDHLIIINTDTFKCDRCKIKHSNNKVTRKEIQFAKALQKAFENEDWDDSIWTDFSRLLSTLPNPIGATCTSVPLELYQQMYETLFDPTSLASWESFLVALRRSTKPKLEFFRYIIGRSLSVGPPASSRHRSLLLKTLRAIFSDPKLDKRYKEMMEGPLSPELKALCLDCFSHNNNDDAKFIFSQL